jgi:hypothetical protein
MQNSVTYNTTVHACPPAGPKFIRFILFRTLTLTVDTFGYSAAKGRLSCCLHCSTVTARSTSVWYVRRIHAARHEHQGLGHQGMGYVLSLGSMNQSRVLKECGTRYKSLKIVLCTHRSSGLSRSLYTAHSSLIELQGIKCNQKAH